MIHRHFISAFVVLAAANLASAQEYQTDPTTGQQYRVTGRQTFKVPVSETHLVPQTSTVYTERVSTEYQPNYRTVYSPVTEYSWEPYVANRWNPFASPTVNYHYAPHTRWDTRTEMTQVPLTRRELVPEQRVTQIPVVTQRFEDHEIVSRVAMTPGSSDNSLATRPIGGVANLQNDPPKNTFESRR